MKKYKCCILLLYLLLFSINIFAQETTIFMDFRNQKISDIIYAVADVCGESVYVDENVKIKDSKWGYVVVIAENDKKTEKIIFKNEE